jgi:hypothetical protein
VVAAGASVPAGSSTTNAVARGKQWLCQVTALPGSRVSEASRSPAVRANRRSIARLPVESSTTSRCWWNQIVTEGRTRAISR